MTQPFTYMSPAGVSKDEASFSFFLETFFSFLFDISHINKNKLSHFINVLSGAVAVNVLIYWLVAKVRVPKLILFGLDNSIGLT